MVNIEDYISIEDLIIGSLLFGLISSLFIYVMTTNSFSVPFNVHNFAVGSVAVYLLSKAQVV